LQIKSQVHILFYLYLDLNFILTESSKKRLLITIILKLEY